VSSALAFKTWREPTARLRAAGTVLVFAWLVAACGAPQPETRTYFDFMEDGIARDGVLARCNQDRDATLKDEECANARRAAAAVAVEQERSRHEAFARESQRKLTALRDHTAQEREDERESEAAARAEEKAAYERIWPKQDGERVPTADDQTTDPAPAFGAPLGQLLPSLSDTYDGQVPGRPRLGKTDVEPPSNEVEIVPPEFRQEDIAVVPERLHAATN
jgi:hypothetical protein